MSKARRIAFELHKDQKYGHLPYAKHLADVVANLYRFDYNVSDDLVDAGWLHDSIEDTGIKRGYISNQINERVAELVWRVSNEQGANRKEKHTLTYPKIAADSDAITLKLADRTANFEHSLAARNLSLLKMYIKEHEEFKDALGQNPTDVHKYIWYKLDLIIKEAQGKIYSYEYHGR